MQPKNSELLERLDQDEGLYQPSSWDSEIYQNIEKRKEKILRLRETLEVILGFKLRVDDNSQDASFFIELRSNKTDIGGYMAELGITFSKFGNLVTMWSTQVKALDAIPLDQVTSLLLKNGYVYIPVVELKQPYSGRHPFLKNSTWLDRFFSYL